MDEINLSLQTATQPIAVYVVGFIVFIAIVTWWRINRTNSES